MYSMSRVPYNKPLTNQACSSRTGEYWPSVVFVRTSRCSVRTVATSGQYSPVRPSRSVSKRLIFSRQMEAIFAHGCDVTSMSLVGSLMALTHSILINLFIKVKLNTFSPTSPAKYCFCPKYFLAYVWLLCQGTREG